MSTGSTRPERTTRARRAIERALHDAGWEAVTIEWLCVDPEDYDPFRSGSRVWDVYASRLLDPPIAQGHGPLGPWTCERRLYQWFRAPNLPAILAAIAQAGHREPR